MNLCLAIKLILNRRNTPKITVDLRRESYKTGLTFLIFDSAETRKHLNYCLVFEINTESHKSKTFETKKN